MTMEEGLRSSEEITVALDNGPGGAPVQIEGLIMGLGGTKIVVGITPATAFGQAWEAHKRTGVRSVPPIKIDGFMETSVLHALMTASLVADPNADTQTLEIGYGDGQFFTVECILNDYEPAATSGNLTKFSAMLQPTGPAGWSIIT